MTSLDRENDSSSLKQGEFDHAEKGDAEGDNVDTKRAEVPVVLGTAVVEGARIKTVRPVFASSCHIHQFSAITIDSKAVACAHWTDA
eukprot:CAMPEP_0183303862 /NCGR_PEP_ID=MMETSP0160_2-20130417/9152_1 /TAXON_ID=2839 ORGANISM="Odontella Sinensis, Strain Grunow 1884" /NCGR_SAMPLE_ID=MMETSP0160_2 /ASSEMBLY_ACC=CAM_ASM_000250 /LENGTH=86 /DNA_ID=CAMNT_0025466827 /DNA_START=93 /DNA_END=350 /DNA_ORIENTATION=+